MRSTWGGISCRSRYAAARPRLPRLAATTMRRLVAATRFALLAALLIAAPATGDTSGRVSRREYFPRLPGMSKVRGHRKVADAQ